MCIVFQTKGVCVLVCLCVCINLSSHMVTDLFFVYFFRSSVRLGPIRARAWQTAAESESYDPGMKSQLDAKQCKR